MVSFDVVSLFIRVPIEDTMDLLGRHFEDILRLFHHVLTTSCFNFNGQFYEQTDGVAMGSPLSPVIANLYMEDFEERALDLAPHKPRCWFRYVDDTFVIWPHGPDKLKDFLNHLNSIQQVYSKSTRTNLYINAASHHHPSNKQAARSTLVHRARALCDQDSLHAKLVLLGDVFRKNRYRQIHRVLNHRLNI
ncbi:uncharacterized protein LOC111874629, partial [Cryptotermes secundus]|uniref:uncharacterized protein LOC111874629 n=1 Tax=Cryptotermes secundus TaxID=105785 RepID=UPI000CD7DAF8